jgi:HAD superfamily hydrolase (TIGR01549 family)
MEIKNIIFDFDGVILNSHQVKTNAFKNIFKKYSDTIAKKAKEYHLNNAGKSRYLKFHFIVKKILKQKASREIIRELNNEFSEYCDSKINKLIVSKYLIEYLKKNYKNKNFFISTGTPQKDILKLIKKIKIKKFFKSIHGSPTNKVVHIKKILSKYKKRSETLFIGDSMTDYEAAKKCGVFFLLKLNSESKNLKLPKKVLKLKSFKYLDRKILSL